MGDSENKGGELNPSLFIEGYFTTRINKGERPKYGYPANHLPTTTCDRMEVATTFMASKRSGQAAGSQADLISLPTRVRFSLTPPKFYAPVSPSATNRE